MNKIEHLQAELRYLRSIGASRDEILAVFKQLVLAYANENVKAA